MTSAGDVKEVSALCFMVSVPYHASDPARNAVPVLPLDLAACALVRPSLPMPPIAYLQREHDLQ